MRKNYARKSGSQLYSNTKPPRKTAFTNRRKRTTTQAFQGYQPGMYRTTGNYGRFQPGGGSEKKFIDILQAAIVPTTTGLIFPTTTATMTPAVAVAAAGTMCQIVQGDQEYQRIGKEIVITKIMMRGSFVTPPASDNATDRCRLLIVQDMQCNGAAPTVNQVLNFTGQPVSVNSFNNIENSKRFIILCDEFFDMNANNVMYNANTVLGYEKGYQIYKKCNIPIVYDSSATTGALATIRSNNIFGIVFAANQVGGGDITFDANIRLRYTDK